MTVKFKDAVASVVLGTSALLNSQSATYAAPQTPAETVAFILYGMEDGRTIAGTTGPTKVRQTAEGDVAVYELDNPAGAQHQLTSVSVTAMDACNFKIETVFDHGAEPIVASFNFGHLTGASENYPFTTITFNGQCPIRATANGECNSTHIVFPGNEPDKARLLNAIEYFKTKFCAGSAF